tara:strand:- start:10497 stop:11240 length:744 start_codon:yes stop_codon:yes gene_type:complete
MINSVRNTVLSILNKNNYGYISPADFNLFALQAQLTIFEGYFTGYNNALNKENARRSGTEYANESKSISESIDIFSVTKSLPIVTAGTNVYNLPSVAATGDDFYLLNKVLCFTDATPAVFTGEAESVSHSKITMLNNSMIMAPTVSFPAYTIEANLLTVFPDTINTAGAVEAQYIRYPFAPNWTYSVVTGGEPMFDSSQQDFQDFEIPIDDEPQLINLILQMCGISIRESSVYQYAQAEETENLQQQ